MRHWKINDVKFFREVRKIWLKIDRHSYVKSWSFYSLCFLYVVYFGFGWLVACLEFFFLTYFLSIAKIPHNFDLYIHILCLCKRIYKRISEFPFVSVRNWKTIVQPLLSVVCQIFWNKIFVWASFMVNTPLPLSTQVTYKEQQTTHLNSSSYRSIKTHT